MWSFRSDFEEGDVVAIGWRRAVAAAAVTALVLGAGACSSDDDGASDSGATTSAPADSGDGGSGGDGGGGAASGNPCDTVTQEQWTAIFGDGVTKADSSGSADNCNVLTDGSSPGHEISMVNLSASGSTTFDDAVTQNAGCSGAPTEVDVADRAVLDTSCLQTAGRAWVVAEDGGDVLLVSLNLGEPASGDPAAIGETFTEVAAGIADAR